MAVGRAVLGAPPPALARFVPPRFAVAFRAAPFFAAPFFDALFFAPRVPLPASRAPAPRFLVAVAYLPPRGAGAAGAVGVPAAGVGAFLSAALPAAVWPRKSRVGANSPSLWPTMFSVTYTGMNLFPLCTANV